MNSPSLPWCACWLAVLGAASWTAAPARACDEEAAQGFRPERSWPAACERDVPTDGLVVLEGSANPPRNAAEKGPLRVQIKRMRDGAAVETFAGEVREVGPNLAVFRSQVPLPEGSDFVVSAVRVAPDGTPLSAPFTSAFTTGHTPLPALAFRSVPTVQLEAFDKELEQCEVVDACGERRCTKTGETVPTHYLRIAVPEIDGGLAKLPYRVSATLTSDREASAVLAAQEAKGVPPGHRSYMLLELPPRDREGRGCVTITASDAAGHEAAAETVCLALPAPEAPPSRPEHVDALRLASPAAPEAQAASAGGCTLGGPADTSGLAWLALILTFSRRRSRKPSA